MTKNQYIPPTTTEKQREDFVVNVLGWRWNKCANHDRFESWHWVTPDGRCYFVTPEFLLRADPVAIQAATDSAATRRIIGNQSY